MGTFAEGAQMPGVSGRVEPGPRFSGPGLRGFRSARNWSIVLRSQQNRRSNETMLVLLGPRYAGTEREREHLVTETGLATYDLRTRLRPGAWSVVRAIADVTQASTIAAKLTERRLQSCALDSTVGQDPLRRIVYLRGIEVMADHVLLRFAERTMKIPLGALLTIVRGDVHLGRMPLGLGAHASSQSLRAANTVPSVLSSNPAPSDVFREPRAPQIHEVFVAADVHFVTVPWLARIDARDCEFSGHGSDAANYAERLDRFIDDLSAAAQIRVDRHVKTSSLASHTAGSQRMATPSPTGPISTRRGAGSTDEHFDAYSRMVGEAERQTFR